MRANERESIEMSVQPYNAPLRAGDGASGNGHFGGSSFGGEVRPSFDRRTFYCGIVAGGELGKILAFELGLPLTALVEYVQPEITWSMMRIWVNVSSLKRSHPLRPL